MTTVNKFFHGHVDFQASDVGLHVAASSKKRCPRAPCAAEGKNLRFRKFPLCAATAWNKVSIPILCSQTKNF